MTPKLTCKRSKSWNDCKTDTCQCVCKHIYYKDSYLIYKGWVNIDLGISI